MPRLEEIVERFASKSDSTIVSDSDRRARTIDPLKVQAETAQLSNQIGCLLNEGFRAAVEQLRGVDFRRKTLLHTWAARNCCAQFERAKWIRPFIRGNRLTRFDIRDLDACIDRLKAGELLPNNAVSAATL